MQFSFRNSAKPVAVDRSGTGNFLTIIFDDDSTFSILVPEDTPSTHTEWDNPELTDFSPWTPDSAA